MNDKYYVQLVSDESEVRLGAIIGTPGRRCGGVRIHVDNRICIYISTKDDYTQRFGVPSKMDSFNR